MSREHAPAVPTRAYSSALRTRQAADTRRRILDAAAECFAASGYAGASLADIATVAGVSVETVKLSGPKRELLLAAFEQSFTGQEGLDSLEDYEPVAALTEQPRAEDYLAGIVHFVAEGNRRSSRLWDCLRGAASADAIIGEALSAMQQRRRSDFLILVAELDRRGLVAPEVDHVELADSLSVVMSPESYTQLVAQAGWSEEHYERWVARTLRLMAWPRRA